MKRYILLLFLLVITAVAHAELPQIVALGKQASKHQDVKHTSVGSIMLGMAGTFAEKEQRATFKMLDNIEIIECKNRGYAPTLVARTKSIANEVDAMIVIGDKHSSNTQKLFEICSNACADTYYIQTLDDLDMNQLKSVKTVGITAGASTPNNIIEEVQNNVRINF